MSEHVDLQVGLVLEGPAALLAGDSRDRGVVVLPAGGAAAPHAGLGRDVGRGVDLAVVPGQRRLRLQRLPARDTARRLGRCCVRSVRRGIRGTCRQTDIPLTKPRNKL